MSGRTYVRTARSVIGAALCAAMLVLLLPALAPADEIGCTDDGFTAQFPTADCKFKTTGLNPYFIPLIPGYRLVLEGVEIDDEGEEVELRVVITVLDATEVVDGVRTRVIEESETEDGELVEVSRNFFAICKETNDVYYFGEDVDDYEDGEIVGHEGGWRAGINGARAGIIMPGTFLLGSRYYQEVAPDDEALDRAEHTAMCLEVETPAGTFSGCVEVTETNPLEPGEESLKIYAPGIGLIVDDDIELVAFGFDVEVDDGDDDDDDGDGGDDDD